MWAMPPKPKTNSLKTKSNPDVSAISDKTFIVGPIKTELTETPKPENRTALTKNDTVDEGCTVSAQDKGRVVVLY
jgi:hypothetical protein